MGSDSNTSSGPIVGEHCAIARVLGLNVVVCRDRDRIIQTLRDRGYWKAFKPNVYPLWHAFLMQQTDAGVDFFVWNGDPDVWGFYQWTLVGGRLNTPECDAVLDEIQASMPCELRGRWVRRNGRG